MRLHILVFVQAAVRFVHLQITYVLSRDCRVSPNQDFLLHHPVTKFLQVDNLEGSMVVLSHNMTSYPRNFSCELVVHSPIENARIMMKIEEFYVPSKTRNCVENYLYVFDSNTAKSKAMTEAGGERGLCGPNYPKYLIFTKKSYICLAFHTSSRRPPILPGVKPGFRVILTAIQETRNSSCPSSNFYCSAVPRFMGANSMITSTSLSADSRLYGSFLSPPQYIRSLDDDRFPPNHDKQYMGYCITKKSLCDGITNCEDRKDEDISHCQAFIDMEDPNSPLLANDDLIDVNSWLSGLLSLGMPASIAIAVSTIVILILGIGVVICCCHRCCLINQTYNNQYSNNRLAFRNGGIFLDTFSRPITAANNNYSYSRSQHLGVMSVNTGAQSQLSDRINLISHIDGDQQKIDRNWQQSASFPPDILMTRGGSFSRRNCNEPNQHHQTFNQYLTSSQNMTTEKESRLHCFTKTPLKLPLLDRYYPLLNPPNETMRSQYFVSVGHHGSDSYSLTNNNSARVYDLQNGQPGPLPALIHGALGSPCTYRRDPLYYTPPPHGAFNVPPASIVTASSSRTGTTSGGPRESVKSGRDQSVPTMGYNTSGNGSGIGICNQQLDGVESVLHTNTPIESISHGGDLSLNGGILYLGNMYRPLSPQNSSLFQVENLGRSSVTTTGSGSSCDRKSHHYFLREIKSHHDDTEAYLQRNPHQQSTYDLFKKSSRRSKTSSRPQHHHHLKHKSIDPNHTISIGSHTSASSRSGALLNLPQLSYDDHEQPFSRFLISAVTTFSSDTGPSNHQPIVFPVQL